MTYPVQHPHLIVTLIAVGFCLWCAVAAWCAVNVGTKLERWHL